jgi:serine/threonine protein phosphatase PrpC
VALLAMTDHHPDTDPPSTAQSAPMFSPKKTSIGRTKWGRRISTSSSESESSELTVDDMVLTPDGKHALSVFIANAGDCRAISMYGDGRMYQLSTDHSPLLPYERWRIYKAGGNIKFGRIEAKLSVSRGFGDRQFKEPKPLVSAMPEIVSFAVTKQLRFVLLACDGVWGWLNNYQVSAFVTKSLKEGNRPDTVCKELVKYAYDHGSTDNISVVLLYFTFEEAESIDRAQNPVSTTTQVPPGSRSDSQATSVNPTPSSPSVSPQSTSPPVPSSPISTISVRRTSKDPIDPSTLASPGLSRRPEVSLSASNKNRRFNFQAAASATTWNLNIEQIERKYDRAGVLTTHIPTGDSHWAEHSEFDSTTSDFESSQHESGPRHGSTKAPLPNAPAPRSSQILHQRHKSTVEVSDGREEDLSSSNQDASNTSSSPRSESDLVTPHLPTNVTKTPSRPIVKSAPSAGMPKADPNSKVSVSPNSTVSIPISRRSQYSAPTEDEDDVYTSQKLKSKTPQIPKRSAAKRHRKLASDSLPERKNRATPAEHVINYGLSDSEDSEEIEDEIRRRSFDDVRMKRSDKSQSTKVSVPAKSASSPITKKKKKTSGEGSRSVPNDSGLGAPEAASSLPASSHIAEKAKVKKKKSALSSVAEVEDMDVDMESLRRAHSFDSPRPVKAKKKAAK